MEGDRFECEDRFARFIHGLDIVLETLRGGCCAKLTRGIYMNGCACNLCSTDAGDKGFFLGSHRADADGVGLTIDTIIADVVTAGGEMETGVKAQGDVAAADGVVKSAREPLAML
jgi:hypothetical protein